MLEISFQVGYTILAFKGVCNYEVGSLAKIKYGTFRSYQPDSLRATPAAKSRGGFSICGVLNRSIPWIQWKNVTKPRGGQRCFFAGASPVFSPPRSSYSTSDPLVLSAIYTAGREREESYARITENCG